MPLDILFSAPVISLAALIAFVTVMVLLFGHHDNTRRTARQNFIIRCYKIHRWAYAVLLGMDQFVKAYEQNKDNPYAAGCDTAIPPVSCTQSSEGWRREYGERVQ